MFYTCADGIHKELAPIYKYCAKRIGEKAVVDFEKNPSSIRFLKNPIADYVHVTDIDILLLPHERTHRKYYSQYVVNGASYIRGATEAYFRKWEGKDSRICGGQVGFFPEYYARTVEFRDYYLNPRHIENYREFDEVMLYRILHQSGYPIPDSAYCFPNNEPWDWEYRDLHIGDFRTLKYLKWKPDKKKVRDLMEDETFKSLCQNLSPAWIELIDKIKESSSDT